MFHLSLSIFCIVKITFKLNIFIHWPLLSSRRFIQILNFSAMEAFILFLLSLCCNFFQHLIFASFLTTLVPQSERMWVNVAVFPHNVHSLMVLNYLFLFAGVGRRMLHDRCYYKVVCHWLLSIGYTQPCDQKDFLCMFYVS